MPKFSIRETKDTELIRRLDKECFPYDEPYPPEGAIWWIAKNQAGKPVAFGGMKLVREASAVFLCRAGVLREARGHGLQKQLIRVRMARARKLGVKKVITYTDKDNVASCNSLIRQNFRLYEPEWAWVGKEFLYWMSELSSGQ